MAFGVRRIKDEDIPTIAEWFANKQWEMPPVENLLGIYGLIAETHKGEPAACCWLYITETAVAYLAWFGMNEKLSEEERHDGVRQLVHFVQGAVLQHVAGIKLLLYYTQDEALAAKLHGLGFEKKRKFIQCSWMPKQLPLKESPQAT